MKSQPFHGYAAIGAFHSPPIGNPGGGNNPVETDSTFFMLDGPDVCLVGDTEIASQTPMYQVPGFEVQTGLAAKLLANVAAVRAGRPIATTTTVPSAPPSAPPVDSGSVTPGSSANPVPDTGPAGVVESYFAAISSHDYQTAWTIGGQQAGGTYGQFVAGFATTDHDVVAIESVQGTSVVATLTAYQTDGTQQTFHGTYTVVNGMITHASVQRTG